MIWGSLIAGIIKEFWRPIAALFGGLAAYGKGRADAAAKAKARNDEHALEAYRDSARLSDNVRRTPERVREDELAKWEQ